MMKYFMLPVFAAILLTGGAIADELLNNYEVVLAEQLNGYCETYKCQSGESMGVRRPCAHGAKGEPGPIGNIGPPGKPGMPGMDGATGPAATVDYTKIEEAVTRKVVKILSSKDCSNFDTNEMAVVKNDTGGVFTIYPSTLVQPLNVYCDLTTDGGKWIVFQRRYNGMVDFVNRNWNEYAEGFGNPATEYWMGLENLHRLTSNGKFELRIDMEDWEGNKRYASYKNFYIGSASTKYQLNFGTYEGNAGDSLTTYHQGRKFSTPDQDNDENGSRNCATFYHSGGWWYSHCYNAVLNGKYVKQSQVEKVWEGIMWYEFTGNQHSLKFTEMKFRPMA